MKFVCYVHKLFAVDTLNQLLATFQLLFYTPMNLLRQLPLQTSKEKFGLENQTWKMRENFGIFQWNVTRKPTVERRDSSIQIIQSTVKVSKGSSERFFAVHEFILQVIEKLKN